MPKQKLPTINIADDNFGTMVNCAVRYALGRRTTVPSTVRRFIYPLLPYLNDRTLYTLEMDLRDTKSYGSATVDLPGWLQLLADTQRVIRKREKEKE